MLLFVIIAILVCYYVVKYGKLTLCVKNYIDKIEKEIFCQIFYWMTEYV